MPVSDVRFVREKREEGEREKGEEYRARGLALLPYFSLSQFFVGTPSSTEHPGNRLVECSFEVMQPEV